MIKNCFGRAFGLVSLLGLGLWACSSPLGQPTEQHSGYQATVEFDERHVGFEFGGRVESVAVGRGQTVTPGEVLARLDATLGEASRLLRISEVDIAKAELALVLAGSRSEDVRAASARLIASRATEQQLTLTVTRDVNLLAAGATSQSVLEQSQTRRAQAAGDRQALEQALKAL